MGKGKTVKWQCNLCGSYVANLNGHIKLMHKSVAKTLAKPAS